MDLEAIIKKPIIALQDKFQNSAVELMHHMFGILAEIREPWEIVDTFEAKFDYIFRLISLNARLKANTLIGANYDALQKMFWEHVSLEEAKDALTEFANVYNGMLMDEPLFVKSFGFMRQQLPEDSTVMACLPVAWGIQGRLYFENCSVFIRFSMEERKFFGDLISSLN
jgi:hypothetical protein